MTGLTHFKTALELSTFGLSKLEALKQGICLHCKRPPEFRTQEGRREYRISGLCEECFDSITKE